VVLFRIEDTENQQGCHRQYIFPVEELPQMRMSEVQTYIANPELFMAQCLN